MLERALIDAHVPTLMAALVHLTGDLGLVREAGTLSFGWLGDYQGKLSPSSRRACAAMRSRRSTRHSRRGLAGTRTAPAPGRARADELRRRPAGIGRLPAVPARGARPAEGGPARSARRSTSRPSRARERFRVLVIGARHVRARSRRCGCGRPASRSPCSRRTRTSAARGSRTRYPGCRVDSPNHMYSYSFEANHDWPQHYSTQDVLLGYFRRFADKHGLREHIRFRTEVEEAIWDDAAALWRVRVRDADGASETLVRATRSISAVGQLNRPQYPDIPGRERFAGASFHSARWDHGVRPPRQARRGDRHRRERVSVRPGDRRADARAARVPALGAVGRCRRPTTTSPCPRACSGCCATCRTTIAGTASGCSGSRRRAAARPSPAMPTGRARRARSARTTTCCARRSRGYMRDAAAGDEQLCAAAIPTIRPAASACCATTAAGSPRSSATTCGSSPSASRRSTSAACARATARSTRSTRSSTAPAFQASDFLQPMRIVGRDGAHAARTLGRRRARLPRHDRSRRSRTCS